MRFLSFSVVAFIGLAPGIVTQADEVEVPGITEIVRKHFPAGSEGGLAMLVTKDNAIIHSKGYGTRFGKERITPQTPMPLASVTKQFAAMCVAMLIEDGKLSMTDKVTKYVPAMRPEDGMRELLIRDLLWHINGLPNFINAKEKESIDKYKTRHGLQRLTNETHADWLSGMPGRRAPGVEFEYTNSGYVLLARIVEIVAGMPFHDFQQQRIFDVLGMTATKDSQTFNGSGNMTTSLEDYAKWDRALWNKSLLNEETTKRLFQSGKLDNGDPVGYAFGWFVEHEGGELVETSHGGHGGPASSARNFVLRDIKNQLTVVLFARENLRFNKAARRAFAEEVRDYVRNLNESPRRGLQSAFRLKLHG